MIVPVGCEGGHESGDMIAYGNVGEAAAVEDEDCEAEDIDSDPIVLIIGP